MQITTGGDALCRPCGSAPQSGHWRSESCTGSADKAPCQLVLWSGSVVIPSLPPVISHLISWTKDDLEPRVLTTEAVFKKKPTRHLNPMQRLIANLLCANTGLPCPAGRGSDSNVPQSQDCRPSSHTTYRKLKLHAFQKVVILLKPFCR